MILTITPNPTIDIQYRLDQLHLDTINRTPNGHRSAGGKGINSARVLANLGIPVLATGVAGGPQGAELLRRLEADGIAQNFVAIAAATRECVGLLHAGQQTEILPAGPDLTAAERATFIDHCTQLIQAADVVIIGGNLPPTLDTSVLIDLIKVTKAAGKPILLDVPSQELAAILPADAGDAQLLPTLIKPNETELSELIKLPGGHTLDAAAVISALNNPLLAAIPWVVVSRGAQGALIRTPAGIFRATVPRLAAVNAVGSGDATTAGFALAISRGASAEVAIRTAMTCGVLNAINPVTGAVDPNRYAEIAAQIVVERI